MSHVADSRKNRLFDPISGRFTPIRPTDHPLRAEGPPTFWHPGNVFGPRLPLATVLPPHAPRHRPPDQRVQVVAQTLPR